ncbi:hypothetical protein B0H21DRAFT_329865 [Amylocystis lapponica]|nr:hypothetical protein B0H21DRAFT_329865 [Amylocystis lapponica]
MIAIPKPPPLMFAAPSFRQSHSRHPSAPVVIRPTHTPGLLSLSKPPHTVPRPQQAQQQRQQRSSPRGKPLQKASQPASVLAQPAADKNKSAAPASKPETAATDKVKAQTTTVSSTDKPPRGRQGSKPAKDKASRRSASLSTARANVRRPPHQPSPPPSTRIPSQAEVSSQRPVKPQRNQPSAPRRASNSNVFDPFVVNSTSDNESTVRDHATVQKDGSKPPSFRSPPQLASHPSGKLARRRQLSAQVMSSPTPSKAVAVPRRSENAGSSVGTEQPMSRSDTLIDVTPGRRANARRASAQLPMASWDSFPICDDSADQADDSDQTPPTTPIRESSSVPTKKGSVSWTHRTIFDGVPRTAPLSSTIGFPFVLPNPASTPTPAQRRRNHRRVPSEGVFNMSMDEDSSSSSDVFNSYGRPQLSVQKRRPQTESRQTPLPARGSTPSSISSAMMREAGFFAGSMFQNSPSPDDLPAPSFNP